MPRVNRKAIPVPLKPISNTSKLIDRHPEIMVTFYNKVSLVNYFS